jgi:hypothetical protein
VDQAMDSVRASWLSRFIYQSIEIMHITGTLRKMITSLEQPVSYHLPLGEERVPLNQAIGKQVTLLHSGEIHCVACGRKTSKSFNQGYCFPCMRSLARCDTCIIKPEKCHYDEGTCREPEWGEENCLQEHVVYLANSSGVKVGITRQSQVPTRWMDQGASQALPVFRVRHRYLSGLLEVALKKHVADKTDWRKMLKGMPPPVSLPAARDALLRATMAEIEELSARFGDDAVRRVTDEQVVSIDYPVRRYPEKIKAHNLDKTPRVTGVLQGIKGQYLILDTGVLNVRKFAGYRVELEIQ